MFVSGIAPVHPESLAAPDRARRLIFAGGGRPPGARRPPLVANGVLAMVIFLGAEAMLFAALMSACLILRAGAPTWPPPGQPRLPVGLTGLNTLVLLASAWTMRRALAAIRADRCATTARWLQVTLAMGSLFLVIQGGEWVRLIGFGLTVASGHYGETFYTLIGCHAVHVLAAVVALGWLLGQVRRGAFSATRHVAVEVVQLYWFFVAGLWPVLYALVYLI
jgi:cytochrome c oxidase subunit 3